MKIRYIKVRLSPEFFSMQPSDVMARSQKRIEVLESGPTSQVFRYTATRLINAIEILEDGTEVKTLVPTMDRHTLRIFRADSSMYMCLLDPSRGSRIATEVLDLLVEGQDYFIESLEITKQMIEQHISCFGSARLVSAKIKDFRVNQNAVARLEVTSKEGLEGNIAPFLEGKFYRLDSMTYEITHQFNRGLVTYMSNGTLRVSTPLIESVFPTFETVLARQN